MYPNHPTTFRNLLTFGAMLISFSSLAMGQSSSASETLTAPLPNPGITLPSGLNTASHPAGAKLNNYGGKIIIFPTFINVYWGSYWSGAGLSDRKHANAFVQTVTPSNDYTSIFQQYTGPGGTTIHTGFYQGEIYIPGAPPTNLTDAQIQSYLTNWIKSGTVPMNTLDLMYNIFFPPGVTITNAQGQTSTKDYCAYHGTAKTTTGTGGLLRYASMPFEGIGSSLWNYCGGNSAYQENLTSVLSHEIAEALTDPDVGLATTYAPPLTWYDPKYGEIGDICNAMQAPLFGFTIQQLFSNADNDCVNTRLDFTLAGTNVTLKAGQSGASAITTTQVGALPTTVTLTISGVPAGVTAAFSASPLTAGSGTALQLTTASSAAPGTYTLVLNGVSSAGRTHTANITLVIQSATVTLTVATNPTALQARIGTGPWGPAPLIQTMTANQTQTISVLATDYLSSAQTGYSFTGWSTGGSTPATTVQPSSNFTATANFKVACYVLAVNVLPAGSGTVTLNPASGGIAGVPSNCYAPGTVVTLTATGAKTNVFYNWSGAATGTAATTTIKVTAPAAAAANFGPPPTVTAVYGSNSLQAINVVLKNISNVGAANLRITNITNVTAKAPNVIVFDQGVVGFAAFKFPMLYGNVAGGQSAIRTFGFRATAGSMNVPFSFVVTYQADDMPPQTAVIQVTYPR